MHEKHHYCIYPFDPHHNQKHPTYLFLRQEEEEDKGGGEEEESSSKRKKKTTIFCESCSITTPKNLQINCSANTSDWIRIPVKWRTKTLIRR